jgi:hypothetical protein
MSEEFKYHTVEIAPLAKECELKFSAAFEEEEEGAIPGTSIVYSGETYIIKVRWWFDKKGQAFARHLAGEWQVKIDLESIGEAKEYTSPLKKIKMDPCKSGTEDNPYEADFKLEPNTVTPAEGGTVYLVAVTLSTLDQCGGPGHIWAYATGPSVMFVEGSPED